MKLRRKRLDPDLLAALNLQHGEHVLAWAEDAAGRPVVASETALHLQRTPPSYTRLGWETIERASYKDGFLTVLLTDEPGSSGLRIPLGDDKRLAIVVRDRVTASIVVDRFITLTDDMGFRVVGRRAPGSDHVAWRVERDAGLPDTEEIRLSIDQALAEVRAEVGAGRSD